MAEDTRPAFWDAIPINLRNAIEQTVPATILQEKLPKSTEPESLQDKYKQLERLLKNLIRQEERANQRSARQPNQPQPVNPRPSSLIFPLAMLQTETKQYNLAEETYREILLANPPFGFDIAAGSNLIEVLNLQQKYAEAQRLGMQVLSQILKQLGMNSPQYLGCMRKVMQSLIGQNKGWEARQLWKRGMELVASIGDEWVKESDAMQEMGRKIDLLA
ncbi:hypothetical protein KCU81_g3223, partial [Aureobasidium melanogenum]|uniref:Tetratricopeptide repeat domain-containing protein n=1 Tax=Aureobasidium melanogenum (strain CBS 110374) TaxID=1043003 RepID=A0A074VMZ2_AURM1